MASVGCHTAQHQTLQKKHVDVDVCNGAQQSAAHLATAQAATSLDTTHTWGPQEFWAGARPECGVSELAMPDGRGSPSCSRLRGWGDRLPQNRTLAGLSYRGSTVLCGVDPAPTRFHA